MAGDSLTVRRNFSSGSVAANSTTSKTYAFGFAATAGSHLVALINANASASTPAGWTAKRSLVVGYAAYLFTRTATGGENSISWTQNGDRPAVVMVWEYDSPLQTATEFYPSPANGVSRALDVYGEGAAVIVRVGATDSATPPDLVWTGAAELADRSAWSVQDLNASWGSCAEIAFAYSGQRAYSAIGMPPAGSGIYELSFVVSQTSVQSEVLAQYSAAPTGTHDIEFDRPATPGYDLLLFGITDIQPTVPSGWHPDRLYMYGDCSFVFRLPGGSNAGLSSVSLALPGARPMVAVVVEALVSGAPTYQEFGTSSGNIVGGTLIGTGLHTFPAGGTEFAVFWRTFGVSQTIGGSFSSVDHLYTLVAQAKREPTESYWGYILGIGRKFLGGGMSDDGVTAGFDPAVSASPITLPNSAPGIIVYESREAPEGPPEEPPEIGDPLPYMVSDGSQWHLVQGVGLQARATATITTGSLAAGASESGTVTLAAGYRLLAATFDAPARFRLYTTSAKRDADASRPIGTRPTGDHGLVLEFVSTATLLAADLSPAVDGYDNAETPDGAIPYRITNTGGGAAAVTVTLSWIRTE